MKNTYFFGQRSMVSSQRERCTQSCGVTCCRVLSCHWKETICRWPSLGGAWRKQNDRWGTAKAHSSSMDTGHLHNSSNTSPEWPWRRREYDCPDRSRVIRLSRSESDRWWFVSRHGFKLQKQSLVFTGKKGPCSQTVWVVHALRSSWAGPIFTVKWICSCIRKWIWLCTRKRSGSTRKWIWPHTRKWIWLCTRKRSGSTRKWFSPRTRKWIWLYTRKWIWRHTSEGIWLYIRKWIWLCTRKRSGSTRKWIWPHTRKWICLCTRKGSGSTRKWIWPHTKKWIWLYTRKWIWRHTRKWIWLYIRKWIWLYTRERILLSSNRKRKLTDVSVRLSGIERSSDSLHRWFSFFSLESISWRLLIGSWRSVTRHQR